MLSGALAGAVSIIEWRVTIAQLATGSTPATLLSLCRVGLLDVLYYALLCAGPAIARRSRRAAIAAILWGVGLSLANLAGHTAWRALLAVCASPGLYIGLGYDSYCAGGYGLSGLLLGCALLRLYGYQPPAKWAPIWGGIGSLVLTVIHIAVWEFTLRWFSPSEDTPLYYPLEAFVVQAMLALIGSVFVVACPTLAIERAMRKRNPRARGSQPET
ncbi:MAG: hypothetical protein NTW87_18450 [Planctomycetota bacterium]|nr:hypothetical protein [Planctomycetota bacterium]